MSEVVPTSTIIDNAADTAYFGLLNSIKRANDAVIEAASNTGIQISLLNGNNSSAEIQNSVKQSIDKFKSAVAMANTTANTAIAIANTEIAIAIAKNTTTITGGKSGKNKTSRKNKKSRKCRKSR